MRTLPRLSLTLAVTALAAASIPAQSWTPPGILLPRNQTRVVNGKLASLQLKAALEAALNTPGDALELSLEGEVQIVKRGAGRRIDASLTRTEEGYEVRLADSMSASLGFDAFQSLDFNLSLAGERAIVFFFPELDVSIAGLQFMSLLQKVKLPELLTLMNRQKELVAAADLVLQGAMHAVKSTRYVVIGAEKAYNGMYRAYRSAGNELRRVGRSISSLRRKVAWAKRKVRRLPRWLRGAARRVLRGAERALSRVSRAHRWVHASFRKVESRLRVARDRLVRARKDYEAKLQTERWRKAAVNSLKSDLARLQQWIDSLAKPLSFTAARIVAIEFSIEGGANVEASLKPSGVELQNLGAGIAGSAKLAAQLRYDFRPKQLSLEGKIGVDVEANAGAMLGVRGEIASHVAIQAVWVHSNRKFQFDRQQSGTGFGLDMQIAAVAGMGVTAEMGAGRNVELWIDWNTWGQIATANRDLLRQPTVGRFVTALRTARCEVTVQDRWIAGSRAGIGFDVGIASISLGASAHWLDQGNPYESTVRAADVLSSIVHPQSMLHTARMLRAVTR